MWHNRLLSYLSLRWRKASFALFVLLLALLVVGVSAAATRAETVPTISIVAVDSDKSVNIQTYNYPPNQTFTVRMGKMGTQGVNGAVVGTLTSGAGGSLTASFPIPDSLKGESQIAVRLESAEGYYSFNWFYNATAVSSSGSGTTSSAPVYMGIPTFSVTSVAKDATVSIKTNNFPPDREFTVRMGAMGTHGVAGTVVGTTNSGSGGEFSATYDIPAALKGAYQIAIRLESADGFYAYNWFYNNTAAASAGTPSPVTDPVTTPVAPIYTGVPTFSIQAVAKDKSVTILTKNLPPDRDFTVRMGAMGTQGANGTVVATTKSGSGGALTLTYDIPAALSGAARIAIRLESADGYYAYNWFYNNSTP
ncbi:MAG: hypothetical protein H6660_14700 [Ardenticatenaceae bacterium]|nr:hypothetical protein [Ardenticatenaceae bacterium]